MTQKTYSRLLELGLTLAKAGFTVVLDAKYDRETLRQPALDQAQVVGIPAQLLHCTAPPEVLESRVRQRSGDIADANVAVLQQQVMEPFTEAERPWVKTVDTTGDVSAQIAAIVGA
jgi:predicted kinase